MCRPVLFARLELRSFRDPPPSPLRAKPSRFGGPPDREIAQGLFITLPRAWFGPYALYALPQVGRALRSRGVVAPCRAGSPAPLLQLAWGPPPHARTPLAPRPAGAATPSGRSLHLLGIPSRAPRLRAGLRESGRHIRGGLFPRLRLTHTNGGLRRRSCRFGCAALATCHLWSLLTNTDVSVRLRRTLCS